jgi:hypothetical protein
LATAAQLAYLNNLKVFLKEYSFYKLRAGNEILQLNEVVIIDGAITIFVCVVCENRT